MLADRKALTCMLYVQPAQMQQRTCSMHTHQRACITFALAGVEAQGWEAWASSERAVTLLEFAILNLFSALDSESPIAH
jgi:hypothetical protein